MFRPCFRHLRALCAFLALVGVLPFLTTAAYATPPDRPADAVSPRWDPTLPPPGQSRLQIFVPSDTLLEGDKEDITGLLTGSDGPIAGQPVRYTSDSWSSTGPLPFSDGVTATTGPDGTIHFSYDWGANRVGLRYDGDQGVAATESPVVTIGLRLKTEITTGVKDKGSSYVLQGHVFTTEARGVPDARVELWTSRDNRSWVFVKAVRTDQGGSKDLEVIEPTFWFVTGKDRVHLQLRYRPGPVVDGLAFAPSSTTLDLTYTRSRRTTYTIDAPSTVAAGSTFTVTMTLTWDDAETPSGGVEGVEVEMRGAGRPWERVTAVTDRDGRAVFTASLHDPTTLRPLYGGEVVGDTRVLPPRSAEGLEKDVDVVYGTSSLLSGPATVAYGGVATLVGQLVDPWIYRTLAPGQRVELWARSTGDWERVEVGTTDASSRATFGVQPRQQTTYELRYAGEASWQHVRGPSRSDPVVVEVAPVVTLRAPAATAADSWVEVSGTVTPGDSVPLRVVADGVSSTVRTDASGRYRTRVHVATEPVTVQTVVPAHDGLAAATSAPVEVAIDEQPATTPGGQPPPGWR